MAQQKRSKNVKSAFTIIELILMIVIMGIAFSTLPTILSVSAKSIESIVDIKGFYHGAAKARLVISKPWDENNVDDYETSAIYYVLSTDEDTGGLVCDNDKNRSGHYPGLNRRMCEAASPSIIGKEGETSGNYDDIDDFSNDGDDLDYYDINTTVQYVAYQSDSPVSGLTPVVGSTSNIKLVTVSVSKNGKAITDYKYYATNIGLAKPFVKPNW